MHPCQSQLYLSESTRCCVKSYSLDVDTISIAVCVARAREKRRVRHGVVKTTISFLRHLVPGNESALLLHQCLPTPDKKLMVVASHFTILHFMLILRCNHDFSVAAFGIPRHSPGDLLFWGGHIHVYRLMGYILLLAMILRLSCSPSQQPSEGEEMCI